MFNGVGDDRIERALVVTAHPGDLVARCPATIRRLTGRRVSVALVVVTSGEKGTEAGGSFQGPDIERIEAAETEAARGLGVEQVRFLREPEAELEESGALRCALVREIRRWRPDVVIGFDPTPALHQHPDHRVTGRLTLDAAWPCAGSAAVYPEAGPAHQPSEAWLFETATPDLFVRSPGEVEERFAQVDFRRR